MGLLLLPDGRAPGEERVLAVPAGETPPPGAVPVDDDTTPHDWRPRS